MYERLINLYAGPSGVGKSGIVARMVADLSAMGKKILYCPEEDSVMLKFRLEAAGADLANIRIAQYRLPKDLDALEFVIRHDGISLVVFDTAQKHITTPMQRWDEPLDLLDEMMHRTKCSAAIIHHTNKNARKGDDWRAAIAGSTAGLTGSSRMIHLVGKKDGRLILGTAKNAYARGNPEGRGIAFDWSEEDVTTADGNTIPVGYVTLTEKDITIDNLTELVVIKGDGEKKGPTPEQLLAAMEFLTLRLADGPACMGDTAKCISPTDCGSFPSKYEGCPDCGGSTVQVLGLKLAAEDAGISTMTLKRAREALDIVGSRKMSHQDGDTGGQGSIPYMRLPMIGDPDGNGGTLTANHPNLNPGAPSELH